MRRCLITLVILAVAFPIWGAPASAMAASETNQQSTTEELRSVEECQMSDAARDAIEEAIAQLKQDNYRGQMIKLIDQARAAARLPECDNEKAIELAEQAKRLAGLKPSSPSKSKELASSKSGALDNCASEAVDGAMIIMTGGLWILTSPFYTTACIMAVVSTDATSRAVARYSKMQQRRYVSINRDKLAQEMAQGRGEYINAMAYLHGCPVEVHDSYAQMTQRNFNQIFLLPELDPETILSNLEAQIAKDPLLAAQCSEVS